MKINRNMAGGCSSIHDQAKLLAAIYNQAVVQEIDYRLDHIYLRISADDALCTKLNQFVL